MRAVKLTYLAIIAAFWWLTSIGFLGAPVSKWWMVALCGLTIGLMFGSIESRTTYRTDYVTAVWAFVWDTGLVFVTCVGAMLWRLDQFGPSMIILPLSTTASFVFFGWPRYLLKE